MDHSSFTKPSDNLLSKTLNIPPLRSLYLLTTLSVHCILFISAYALKMSADLYFVTSTSHKRNPEPCTMPCKNQLSSEMSFGSGECADNAADTIVSEERYMWHKRDFQLFCFPTVNKQ